MSASLALGSGLVGPVAYHVRLPNYLHLHTHISATHSREWYFTATVAKPGDNALASTSNVDPTGSIGAAALTPYRAVTIAPTTAGADQDPTRQARLRAPTPLHVPLSESLQRNFCRFTYAESIFGWAIDSSALGLKHWFIFDQSPTVLFLLESESRRVTWPLRMLLLRARYTHS